MSESFDPYHKWLGIPPEEQPANHYRLLGIKPLEGDPDVIESAADQRMAHLRTHQTGKQGALSQALLNEVAVAKVCLLDRAKKAAYDEELRSQLEASAVAAGASAGFDFAGLLDQPASASVQHSYPQTAATKGPSKPVWILAGAGVAAGLLLSIIAVAVYFSGA